MAHMVPIRKDGYDQQKRPLWDRIFDAGCWLLAALISLDIILFLFWLLRELF
jgi:hypothetical protein